MIKLILLGALGALCLLALFFAIFNKSDLSANQKVLVSIAIGFGVCLIIFYTYFQNIDNKNNSEIMLAFTQGKNITCKDLTISKDTFNLVNGTLTFVGKSDTAYQGETFLINNCHISK